MSLSIAIDQIQRPSFYGVLVSKSSSNKAAKEEIRANDAEIVLEVLRNARGPVRTQYIKDRTGYGCTYIGLLGNRLVAEGRARVGMDNYGYRLIEAVK